MMKRLFFIFTASIMLLVFQNCGKIGDTQEFASLSSGVPNSDSNGNGSGYPDLGSDDSNVSKLLFFENFDDQRDWVSASDSPRLPTGWSDKYIDDLWNPDKGFPNHHYSAEILSSNASKAKGGQGKSYVAWRESHDPGWKKWNSDATIVKHFPSGYDSLYVSFWINFSPNFTYEGTSKIFRMFSWNETGEIFNFFSDGNSGPIFLWDYSHSTTYGVRNAYALRGGNPADHYKFANGDIPGLPRGLVGLGDMSLNFTEDTAGMGPGGVDPKITDKLNGGYISDNMKQTVQHKQIFGESGTWTKIAFYVKMNSAPNVQDGVLMQWIDDELVFNNSNIPWLRGDSSTPMVKWNVVGIGGNDFFRSYPNEDMHEEWYSIDDVMIHTDIPDYLPRP